MDAEGAGGCAFALRFDPGLRGAASPSKGWRAEETCEMR
jgi:hypothetical protein